MKYLVMFLILFGASQYALAHGLYAIKRAVVDL